MNILIPNATGPTNIGDQFILEPIVIILKKNFSNSRLTIHTTTPNLYKNAGTKKIDSHLYNWAVFENRSTHIRIKRVTELLLNFVIFKYFKKTFLTSKNLESLINDYKNADLTVFIGGGYFRSKKGISQSLNLLMILLLFKFSALTNSKKIIAPISFGPFAYKWQEKFSASIIRNFDLVLARESYSYIILKRYKIKNLILSSDTSFLFEAGKISRKQNKNFVLGFTIRKWLEKEKQDVFEKEFVKAITSFSKKTGAVIQPIVQVEGDEYGESDLSITLKISGTLKKNKIKVLKVHRISNINRIYIYSHIDLLLGMRMHSNILAALQDTPFVAISYEHKTEGIAKDLGIEEYVIKCTDVNSNNLYDLLVKTYENRGKLKNTIEKSILKIRRTENKRWNEIFKTLEEN